MTTNVDKVNELNQVNQEILKLREELGKTIIASDDLKWANTTNKCGLIASIAIGAATAAVSNAFAAESPGRITCILGAGLTVVGGGLWNIWKLYKNDGPREQIREQEKEMMAKLDRLMFRRAELKLEVIPKLIKIETELEQIERDITTARKRAEDDAHPNLLNSTVPFARIRSALTYNLGDNGIKALQKRKEELLESLRDDDEKLLEATITYDENVPPPPPGARETDLLLDNTLDEKYG